MIVFSRGGGLLGRLMVDRLGRFGHSVGVLGASPEQVKTFAPADVTAIALDNERDVVRQLAYAEALLLIPPGAGEHAIGESALLDVAKRAGVRRVLRLSLHGADVQAGTSLLRQHGQADASLSASGLPHSILRPHLLMQDLLLFAPSIRNGHPLRGPLASPRIGFVDIRDVADAAVALLQRPVHEGNTFTLTGSRTWSLDEVARAMGEAINEPVAFETIRDDDMQTHLESIGIPPDRAARVASMLAAYRHDEPATRSISRVTGMPPRALEMFLLDQRSHFTARPRRAEPIMGEVDVVQLDHALTW